MKVYLDLLKLCEHFNNLANYVTAFNRGFLIYILVEENKKWSSKYW